MNELYYHEPWWAPGDEDEEDETLTFEEARLFEDHIARAQGESLLAIPDHDIVRQLADDPIYSPRQLFLIAEVLNENDRHEAARRVVELGMSRKPVDVNMLVLSIILDMDAGRDAQAQANFVKLFFEVPREKLPLHGYLCLLGYLRRQDLSLNEADFRDVVADFRKFFPEDERSYLEEAYLEEHLGRPDKATDVLKKAIERNTTSIRCANVLLRLQLGRGEFEAAQQTAQYGVVAVGCVESTNPYDVPKFLFGELRAKYGTLLNRYFSEGKAVTELEFLSLSEEIAFCAKHFDGIYDCNSKAMLETLDYLASMAAAYQS